MYEIYWNDSAVGHAEVKKEGMYYLLSCICTLPEGEMYRVSVTDGRNRHDLGITVPENGKFVLKKRIACKALNLDALSFALHSQKNKHFAVPVAANMRFDYLDMLEYARLRVADGQAEIIIEPAQVPQDSDPNQIHQNK